MPVVRRKEIDVYECPDCGFEYNAIHEDIKGGYTCPECNNHRCKEEVLFLTKRKEAK